jgi:drug/metabolite transporter (DMT)-like permease
MSRRGALLFAAMCVIWGVPYLMIRVAVREISPAALVFGRTAIGALVLMPFALRTSMRPILARWWPLLAYTVIEVSLPWVLLAHAETRLASSLTGLLIAAVPLVGAVLLTIRGHRQGGRRWLGLAIGMTGVAALLGLDLGGVSTLAVAEVFAVAVCYAVGPIILARSLSDLPAMGVVIASLVLSALVYAPFAAWRAPERLPSGRVLLSVLGLAVVCTALAFLVFFALIAEVGPVRATVITYVNPAVAALLGVAVLDERLTAGMVVGFALILAGSYFATGGDPEVVAEP